jgi:hypothetical protein
MSKQGNQIPTFTHCENYTKTEGGYAADISRSYDLVPHPWQETVLNDWLAVDDNGILIHSFCCLLVPRQNGKTGVSDPRETWGLVKRGEWILHTAQEFQTAKKAFDRLRRKFGTRRNDPYAEYPELNALVDRYTVSAGQMVLDLKNGGHIEFRTRGNNSDMGRGGTFDVVVIDEAQSYTEAQDAALSPLNSAAPSGSPQTILMGTPPQPSSGEKGFIFARTIERFHEKPEKGSCLHQWSVDELVDPLNKEYWFLTNPSLNYQLLESALEKDAVTMSADSFAREHLGFVAKKREMIDYAISQKAWDSCASDDPKPDGKTAYGVKFSADGSEVCLCGAVIDDEGKARISMIDRKSTGVGTQWLADWLNQRYNKACCVVIDGRNGVDVLVDKIAGTWKYKNSVIRPSTKDVVAAVSTLVDDVNTQNLTWFRQQDALRDSAINSTKRPIGGGWGFGGENSTPIEAASLALWGCKTSKRNPNKQMRIG